MIIKTFEEQVERFCHKTAIKTAEREYTYGRLDEYANRVARGIIAEDGCGTGPEAGDSQTRRVALWFEHGSDMIVGALGVLKADNAYVPLDISYPEKRLLYILENSGSFLILTNNRNQASARQLAEQSEGKYRVLNIETIDAEVPGTPVQREVSEERTAYILYTSGSTGKPKGVYQTLRNMWYYTRNWIQRFSITESDRMSLFTSFTHDGAVQDIFSALLSGACLYPYSMKNRGGMDEFYILLIREKITVWHSVPSLFRFFSDTLTEKDQFYDIRWVLLGGEPLREHDLELYESYFPGALLANVYGQTESSVSTICTISRENTFDDVSLGQPLDKTEILLVDEDENIVETMGIGEIVVSCDHIAPGYWMDPESSEEVFTNDDDEGLLYWTGDLGRLTADGDVKMMGRKDFQVKVRGFRVETGEIETALLRNQSVREAVISAKPDQDGDNYLCAYLVTNEPLEPEELRKYLALELPDYMIPRYFIFLEKMPLNSTGKIDRPQLPEPGEAIVSKPDYAAPSNETEEKTAAVWQEVLGVEKVGIDDNFVELGGHSLLVIGIIAKIHQEFDVELQLSDVFEKPTVRELSRLIDNSVETVFSSIESVEDKEYYPATDDQQSMFVLNQLEGIGITYNLPIMIVLQGDLQPRRFEQALWALVKRHDAFRTSFWMLDDRLVQVIHREVDFQVSYVEDHREAREIVNDFYRPFDLSKAPLLRARLAKRSPDEYLLLLDTHHIIADGVSQDILRKEFATFFEGEELPGLKLRYRDYAEWKNRFFLSNRFKEQETYWLDNLRGDIPELNLPFNFPRPDVQDFAGDVVYFILNREMNQRMNQLVKETGTTMFIVLLTVYIILLYKYSGQEDILVGSIIAGRNHVELENIVGMFAKTIVLRNNPAAEKTFETFLQDVKLNTLKAFENQDYPFNQLVQKLGLRKKRSRNPLFDAAFVLQNRMELSEKRAAKIKMNSDSFGYEMKTARFDLTFEASERSGGIFCSFQYCSSLFKRETIELMRERFLILLENILDNRRATLTDLDYAISIEREIHKSDGNDVEFDF